MADNNWRRGFSCKALAVEPKIDGSKIRGMLDLCQTEHRCGLERLKFPDNSNVIDCKTNDVVHLCDDMEYLALSYVWGDIAITPTVHNEAQTPDFLFPLVVQDAMQVVRETGYRYLWVDRYCIQQHDNSDKDHQIRQMANIYANAVATICSLGAHANIGLPGVSAPRDVQLHFKSQGYTLLRYPWHGPDQELQPHLQKSRWITRGRTFQEPLLSRRCLFFTSDTTYQICHEGTCGEILSISGCMERQSMNLTADLFNPECHRIARQPYMSAGSFVREVQDYQTRDFTYQGDTLNAFRGILSVVDMQSYWGVPVLAPTSKFQGRLLYTTGFAVGLFWYVVVAIRSGQVQQQALHPSTFPSWSWVFQNGVLVDFV